jgi:hypothetical protein
VLERYEEIERYLMRSSDIDDDKARKGQMAGVQYPIDSSHITSHDSSHITSHDSSHITSHDSSHITSHDSSHITSHDSGHITSHDSGHSARAAIHGNGDGVSISAREHLQGFDNYSISLNCDKSAEDERRQSGSSQNTNKAFFDHRHSRREGMKASSGRSEPDLALCEDTCACWLRQLTATVPVLLPVCTHMPLRTYKRCFSYDADYEAVP